MRTPRVYRFTTLAALAASAVLAAACDDSTGSLSPAERADVVRTLVELGTTNNNRILRAGHIVRVSAMVTDAFDQPLPGVPLIWTTTAGGGAVAADSFNTGSDGVLGGTWLAGTRAGVQGVVATVNGGTGISHGTNVIVYADTVVGTLDLAAEADSVIAGGVVQVQIVSAADRYGNPYVLSGTQPDAPPPIEFTSLNPGLATLVATTASSAMVRGLAVGTAKVVARSDGKADTVTIRVVPLLVPTPH